MLLTCSENFKHFTYKPNFHNINQLDLSRQASNSSAQFCTCKKTYYNLGTGIKMLFDEQQ